MMPERKIKTNLFHACQIVSNMVTGSYNIGYFELTTCHSSFCIIKEFGKGVLITAFLVNR